MARTSIACVVAWLLPGGGHFYLGRWRRGIVFLGAVLVLFFCGLAQDGRVFGLEAGFFGVLRFIADAAVGAPYLLASVLGWGHGQIESAGYEYGNTFLYTAGLVNMLIVLDAYDIAEGRKQ